LTWVVLRTAVRQEKRTAAKLWDEGVFCYAPMYVHKIAVKTRRMLKPRYVGRARALMPGYVFAYLPDDHAIDTARSVRTVREIMADAFGKPRPVELDKLRTIFLADVFRKFDEMYEPPRHKGRRYTHRFKPKDQVKIDKGPFAGFVGEVMRTRGRQQVELMFSIFGRLQEITIDESDLVATQPVALELAA